MKIIKNLTFTILSILGLVSCKYDFAIPVYEPLPDTVSFLNDIIPIFDESCNMSSCHTSGGIAPDLSANVAYDNLLLYGSVDTLNPENSILYTKMNDNMPPTGLLSTNKINLILKWIDQGANEN